MFIRRNNVSNVKSTPNQVFIDATQHSEVVALTRVKFIQTHIIFIKVSSRFRPLTTAYLLYE